MMDAAIAVKERASVSLLHARTPKWGWAAAGGGRSYPNPWCNYGGVTTAISGLGRIGQTATAGSLTKGSSLTGATDSRVL